MFIDLRIGAIHEPLSGRRWTAEELWQRARRRTTRLFDLGVRRGQRVFIHYGNNAEFFVDLLSLWLLGACPVPVDPRFTAFEVEQLARAVAPTHTIWDKEVPAELRSLFAALAIAVVDAADTGDRVDDAVLHSGLPLLDDDALLLFTSGTTGQPKGVVHTHRSLRARWNHQHERLGSAAFERTLVPVATHFAWGLIGNCLFAWLTGRELLLVPAFRQDVLLRLGALCDEFKVTCLVSVPMMWRVALKVVAPPKGGTVQRVTSGTAPLTPALWRDVQRWSGAREVFNVYGITETGWLAGAAQDLLDGDEPLVGEPWGTVIRILEGGGQGGDPGQLRACKAGENGHVWVQSAALMKGYFGQDELTRQVVRHGWFCTGDLGYLDDRGRLYLRGRDKEQINIGGSKVYPADVDAAAEHEMVRDVCTFGIEDPLQGEDVAIAVVLRESSEAALATLYGCMSGRLAPHQMPRRWYLIDEIPRTARGKLNRVEVARVCSARTPVLSRVLERALRAPESAPDGR